MDLSIVIPAHNEQQNIADAIVAARNTCDGLGIEYEIVAVDAGSTDGTHAAAQAAGAKAIRLSGKGYGTALREGFAAAQGEFVLTMDADLSHPPAFIERLWQQRDRYEMIIASRYVPAAYGNMPLLRKLLSRISNLFFSRVLAIPVRDLSSGFRLYRRSVLMEPAPQSAHFEILQEILVSLYNRGYRIGEVPLYYKPRSAGAGHARTLQVGSSYLVHLFRLWKRRNHIDAADYDFRAFYSRHFFQRYWQRKRYRLIEDDIDAFGPILDVGCGSGVFAAQYPGVVGIDLRQDKLRFLSRFNHRVVKGEAGALPFPDNYFATVICSQVIEHTLDDRILPECARVLRPGGVLIVGTVDYGSWQWPAIESVYQRVQPGGYADEHINRYTSERLTAELTALGLSVTDRDSILHAEIIFRARKPK